MANTNVAMAVCLMVMMTATVVAAAGGGQSRPVEPGCFCDCMSNRCMTLGGGASKYDCADACTDGCLQIGQPGQPTPDDFCGF